MTQSPAGSVSNALRTSHTLRIVAIGVLVLILQLPIVMIGGLISERQDRRQEAVAEVSSKWGNTQNLVGPALVVPYTVRWTETTAKGKQVARSETRDAVFLPEQLSVAGTVQSQIRYRGIFPVAVYRLDATVEGEFAKPNFADLGIQPAEVDWQKARLSVGVSDVRAIQRTISVDWNGSQSPFMPGTGGMAEADAGIHATVPAPNDNRPIRFTFPISLNGSTSIYFVPFGKTTTVDLQSNYRSPSFQGTWLPAERTLSATGFRARWSIPSLGRNYPQAWKAEAGMRGTVEASRFGVDLVDPLDQYQMATRSVKYAGLFLVLTFGTIWLIEVLAAVRVHPIQYLLLGAALCLFYVLELALSEHLGFSKAYSVASISVVGMLGAYCLSVLRKGSRALGVSVGVAALYGYLWVLLTNQDYALLFGAVGLFLILGAVMFVTRRVDWFGGEAPPRVS